MCLSHYFSIIHLANLIGRLWHAWAALSQPLIFFKVSSVPRHSCHICHLKTPTGRALFRTELYKGVTSIFQRVQLVCTVRVFVILIGDNSSSKNLQSEPTVAVSSQNWMATNAQCGCRISIYIYKQFRHLAHVHSNTMTEGEGVQGHLNRTLFCTAVSVPEIQ